jgi:hypothetical protein
LVGGRRGREEKKKGGEGKYLVAVAPGQITETLMSVLLSSWARASVKLVT